MDVLHSEVKDWFRNEDDTLLQHIEPSRLSLDVGLHTWLTLLRFVVGTWLDQVDVGCCVQQINEHLELRARILLLKIGKVRGLLDELRVYFCLDFDFDLFFDLHDNVSIDCLTLINRPVFVELQDDRYLCLVSHG